MHRTVDTTKHLSNDPIECLKHKFEHLLELDDRLWAKEWWHGEDYEEKIVEKLSKNTNLYDF